MKNGIIVISMLFLIIGSTPIKAQRLYWETDFVGFFDNREYKSDHQYSQTLFGSRLSPEIGIGTKDGRFRLMALASWIQPIDATIKNSTVEAGAYFRHISPQFKMSFGIFPRTQLIEQLPDVMLYDSLLYFSPHIRGALFQYQHNNGYIEAYVDWRSMQTERKREAFLLSLKGRYNGKFLFAGGNVMMNHLARTKNAPEGMSVIDDILLNPYIGIDLSHRTLLDSLSVKCGYLIGLERNRGIGDWQAPQGFLSEIVLEWRFLGIKNILYAGEHQQPFYPIFGALLNQGDPFYQTDFYNRTNVYCYLFRNHFVNCLASVNLHCSNCTVDLQQQLVVRMNLNNLSANSLKKKNQKRIWLKNIF